MNIGDIFTIAGVHQPPRSRWRRLLIRLRLMKPPTDTPLRSFRVTMTADERSAFQREQLEHDRLHLLEDGGAVLHDLTNVAWGTWGYAVHSLEREGLMSCAGSEHGPDGYRRWRYTITPKGRSYLQSAQQNS